MSARCTAQAPRLRGLWTPTHGHDDAQARRPAGTCGPGAPEGARGGRLRLSPLQSSQDSCSFAGSGSESTPDSRDSDPPGGADQARRGGGSQGRFRASPVKLGLCSDDADGSGHLEAARGCDGGAGPSAGDPDGAPFPKESSNPEPAETPRVNRADSGQGSESSESGCSGKARYADSSPNTNP